MSEIGETIMLIIGSFLIATISFAGGFAMRDLFAVCDKEEKESREIGVIEVNKDEIQKQRRSKKS